MRARQSGDERGAAAVEFAFISILFFTLLFAMIQYSLYFWSTQSAANAARDAARRGAVGQTCTAMRASVRANTKLASGTVNVTRQYFSPTDLAETSPLPNATNTSNVRIVISYNSLNLHYPLVPLPGNGAVRESSLAKVENYSPSAPAGTWDACP